MERPLMTDDLLEPEHLKDDVRVVVSVPGEYDPDTGEYGDPTEQVLWTGKGSIQPYVRASMTAVQDPVGGIALAVDAMQIYLPYEALAGRDQTYRIKSGARYFEPKHKPLDPGGQHDYWVIIAAEVNR